jgi:hypothetical protein
MRWTEKNGDGFYKGKNKGFNFTISRARDYNAFYVVASHQKKDIRLNTLWIKKTFATFDLAEEFCKTFDYKKYKCLGDDV